MACPDTYSVLWKWPEPAGLSAFWPSCPLCSCQRVRLSVNITCLFCWASPFFFSLLFCFVLACQSVLNHLPVDLCFLVSKCPSAAYHLPVDSCSSLSECVKSHGVSQVHSVSQIMWWLIESQIIQWVGRESQMTWWLIESLKSPGGHRCDPL